MSIMLAPIIRSSMFAPSSAKNAVGGMYSPTRFPEYGIVALATDSVEVTTVPMAPKEEAIPAGIFKAVQIKDVNNGQGCTLPSEGQLAGLPAATNADMQLLPCKVADLLKYGVHASMHACTCFPTYRNVSHYTRWVERMSRSWQPLTQNSCASQYLNEYELQTPFVLRWVE